MYKLQQFNAFTTIFHRFVNFIPFTIKLHFIHSNHAAFPVRKTLWSYWVNSWFDARFLFPVWNVYFEVSFVRQVVLLDLRASSAPFLLQLVDYQLRHTRHCLRLRLWSLYRNLPVLSFVPACVAWNAHSRVLTDKVSITSNRKFASGIIYRHH